MKTTSIYFSRTLCVLAVCGALVASSCEKPATGNVNSTEQEGNQDSENENETEKPAILTTDISVDQSSITATTASFSGTVTVLPEVDESEVEMSEIEVGLAYASDSKDFKSNKNTKIPSKKISEEGEFEVSISKIPFGTKFYYCSYLIQDGVYTYGTVKEFTTVNIVTVPTVDNTSITSKGASISCTVTGLSETDKTSLELGIAYSSTSDNFKYGINVKVPSKTISEEGTFTTVLEDLSSDRKYYYCAYVKQENTYTFSEPQEFKTLSSIALLWADEFNGTEALPDQTHWKLCEYGPYAWAQYFVNDSWDNVKVEEGYLKLKADKVDGKYRNGGIRTKEGFPLDTRVEVRAKLTKLVRGGFPAIWQMPITDEGWPNSGEIDIMEWVQGNSEYIFHTIHRSIKQDGSDNSAHGMIKCDMTQWHTFTVDRTNDRLTFYIDDKKTWEFENEGYGKEYYPFSHYDFDLILNMSLGGYLGESLTWPGAINDEDLPGEMWVDWVRVYTL